MKLVRALAAGLVVCSLGASGADFYASPVGTAAGNGSFSQPWDLATALNGPAAVQPGDRILLAGGIYRGSFTSRVQGSAGLPVTIQPLGTQRVTIDGSILITGPWVIYRGLEIMNSSTVRISADIGPSPGDIVIATGFNVRAPNVRLINNIIHDTSQGISTYSDAPDTEVYGNILFYNGWLSPEDGHGHAIYAQNSTGSKILEDNIAFHQFSHGIHVYGSDQARIDYIQLLGNVLFNNGLRNQSYFPGFQRNILLGGGASATDPVVVSNYTYYPPSITGSKGDNNFGHYLDGAGCTNLTLDNNYFVAGYVTITRYKCTVRSVQGNTFYGPVRSLDDPPNSSLTPAEFPNNRFFDLGTPPPGIDVFVRANRYESGRGNITVFNWTGADSVTADISSLGLAPGTHFGVFDAQNIFGPPVVEQDYASPSISIPMTGTAVTPIVGTVPYPPAHTDKEFGAFVVRPLPAADTTAPAAAISAPADGNLVSGVVQLRANVTDAGTIAGVRFKVDGVFVGPEITIAPYRFDLDTATLGGGNHSVAALAWDSAGNAQLSPAITMRTATGDTTPPVISGGLPAGVLAVGTQTATLEISTDENANCKYSATAGVSFASMTLAFTTTGGRTHTVGLTGLRDGVTYRYYARCQDTSGNATAVDFMVSFSVGTSQALIQLAQTFALNGFKPYLEGQWQGIRYASDGNVYFGSSTHSAHHGASFFKYNSLTGQVELLALDITTICGEDPYTNPQGKLHSGIVEANGWLYFSTHFSSELPGAYTNWTGSHVIGYQLATGVFRDYGVVHANYTSYSGIGVDPSRNYLYVFVTGLDPGDVSYVYRIDAVSGVKQQLAEVGSYWGTSPWMFVDQRGDVWFAVHDQNGTFRRIRGATGEIDTYPNVLPPTYRWDVEQIDPSPTQQGKRSITWMQPLDGDRAVFTEFNAGGMLYVFDSTKAIGSGQEFQAIKHIGSTHLGLAVLNNRVFYYQRANRGFGDQEAQDFHLFSVPVSPGAPITDHGLIQDQDGRLLWRAPGMATDGNNRVFMIGDWWTIPGDLGSLRYNYSNGVESYIQLPRGEFFAIATVSIVEAPDFSISATPPTQSVLAGGSASFTITVTPASGFAGTIGFTVSGLPGAATSNFNPVSLAGGGSSTLAISTATSTPPGSYSITITGASGALSRSTNVTLIVTGFSLSATPASNSVPVGGSTSFTATLTALNGFSGATALTVTGLPAGAGFEFSPASLNGSGTSTLSITTAGSTPAGSYPLTLNATSGGLTRSANVTLSIGAFTIAASPATRPVLQGGSTTFTATIAVQNGFAGTARLSVSGLPSGATGSFSPASLTGAGSSTLTVATSAAVTSGNYPLTITGTSGSLSQTANVTLSVTGFSLAATPANQTIAPGGSASFSATVTAENGFAGATTLAVAGLPPGATFGFSPPTVTGGATSTLTVNTLSTTPNTDFPLVISATSGSLNRSSNVTLSISGVAAPAFTQYVEAETGSLLSAMRKVVSSPTFIRTVQSNLGSATYYVTVPFDATLRVLGRVSSPQLGYGSFYVSVDGGPEQLWDVGQQIASPSHWEWLPVRGNGAVRLFPLAAGTHRFTFRGGAVNTQLDTLVFTSEAALTPTAVPVDNVAPIRSNPLPLGPLPAGTSSATISLATNEFATCRFSVNAGLSYDAMENVFSVTGGATHSFALAGLTDGTHYGYLARCQDAAGNINTQDYPLYFSVASPGQPAGVYTQYFEAEWGAIVSPMFVTLDTQASGGKFIRSSMSNQGTATHWIVLPTAGSYALWGRVLMPATLPASFYVSIDGGPEELWSAGPSTSWNWRQVTGANGTPRAFTLAAGQHTVVVRAALGNTYLDRLLVTNDPFFDPSGQAALTASNGTPSGVLASTTTQTSMGVSTNKPATCRYSPTQGLAFASMTGIFTTTGGAAHSVLLTNLTGGTSYTFYIRCNDGAATSSEIAVQFSIADGVPPTVSIGPPAPLDTVSGTIGITATASDNAGVSDVQLLLDGNPLGTPDTVAPYVFQWDTTGAANGNHVLTAVARDAAGNTQSASVTVTVANVVQDTSPPTLSSGAPTGTLPAGSTQAVLAVSTNEAAVCRYSSTAGVPFASMTGVFTTTGGTAHSTQVSGLADGVPYSFFIRCRDSALNANLADYVVSFSVAAPVSPGSGFTQYVEAESGVPISPMRKVADGSIQFIRTVQTNFGTASYALTLPTPATLAMFGLVWAPQLNFGSFYVSVDDGPEEFWNLAQQITAGYTWQWHPLRVGGALRTFSLAAGTHTFRIRGGASNTGLDRLVFTTDLALQPSGPPPVDTTPPVLSNPQPASALPSGATSATLSLTTNEFATCRYSSNAGLNYEAMGSVFTVTGGTTHSVTVNNLVSGTSYAILVRCQDAMGNPNALDFPIYFSVARLGQPAELYEQYFEAESGALTSPIFITLGDSQVSGGKFIRASMNNAGTATYQLTVPAAGSYQLWGRVNMPGGIPASFYVSVDGGPEELWNGGLSPVWSWKRVTGSSGATRTFDLGPGTHTIVLRTGNANTYLDKLLLTNDSSLTP